MNRRICAAILGFLVMLSPAFAAAAAQLRVLPEFNIHGDPVEIELRNLSACSSCELRLELTDAFGSVWQSTAAIPPESVSLYRNNQWTKLPDPHRLFWSAQRVHVAETAIDQIPREKVEGVLTLVSDNVEVASTRFAQWIQAPGVTRTDTAAGVVGSLYAPKSPSGLGILVLGGSGGGMTWSQQIAATLASKGHHALGLAYFNARELPRQVDRIPLEYFETAIQQLKATSGVDPAKIVLLGQSWGAQAALVYASRYPNLAGIVAYVGGSAAFQGLLPPGSPLRSSWSDKGKEIPFAPMTLPAGFSEPSDPIQRWMILLAQSERFAQGAIPIERISAPILLLSAKDDRIWPSTYMSEQLVVRAKSYNVNADITHHAYQNAGHGITQPPFTPTTAVVTRNGGTPEGNAIARMEAWGALNSFLDKIKNPRRTTSLAPTPN